jgi:segregation and condensation protein B
VDQLLRLVGTELSVERAEVRAALEQLALAHARSASELREVAEGFRFQVRSEYSSWVSRLWLERPPRFSRALLETLALVVYRQPITRGDIEDIRGVSVATSILRTLLERGWVREVGHREVPGRPALYATTTKFLGDFNLKSLDELPPLPDVQDLDKLEAALQRLDASQAGAAEIEMPAAGDAPTVH